MVEEQLVSIGPLASEGQEQQQQQQQDSIALKNELSESSSLYLRSHKDNPVAWQEWSSKTIELARRQEKLIFLSVGYSACHWCHVMERESFSSPEIAAILNKSFIPIKLDRESRPDLDDIYMNYVTATTGSGGWPLNVFLTPSLQPVFGGTYWPGPSSNTVIPADTDDRPLTFLDIITKMEEIWRTERERCLHAAADITRQLQAFAAEGIYAHSSIQVKGADDNDPLEPLDLDLLDDALDHFVSKYDAQYGGFVSISNAPKFPTPSNLTFLLRIGASMSRPSTHTRFGFPAPIPAILGKESCTSSASMAIHTLLTMSRSGLRDHLGHGFHRYSVTPDWNLPHFEKMTYDNAQLLSVYCDAWALGRDPEILGTIYDLVEYFTDPESPIVRKEGGWYSSEDADSSPDVSPAATHAENKEGAYYVWTLKELQTILGEQNALILARHYGVKEDGNVPRSRDVNDEFISQNVLHIDATPSVLAKEFGLKEAEIVRIIKTGRQQLREHRESKRGKPAVDDKVIVSWNGLVILALARAANTLITIDPERADRCKDAAVTAVEFIKSALFDSASGLLTRVFSPVTNSADPTDRNTAFLDDYAYLIQGLIKLYDITMDHAYLDFAFKLQDTLDRDFYAVSAGGYFQAARTADQRKDGITSPTVLSSPPAIASDHKDARPKASPSPPEFPDRILNLKPGTDNSMPSVNGVVAQNLLYLASYASSTDVSETTSPNDSSLSLSTSKSSTLQYQARKTIDAFAPEIIQHPFLYVTLLGAVVLDTIGVKCLIIPPTMTYEEAETRQLRGFGRTVVRIAAGSASIRDGEVMICSKEGVCRPLVDGELDKNDYIDDIDATATTTTTAVTTNSKDIADDNKKSDGSSDNIGIVDGKTKEERELQARAEDEERRRSRTVSPQGPAPAPAPAPTPNSAPASGGMNAGIGSEAITTLNDSKEQDKPVVNDVPSQPLTK